MSKMKKTPRQKRFDSIEKNAAGTMGCVPTALYTTLVDS